MKDLISVIVPCYNIEKYVYCTVQSILKQSYQYLEVILVDDGSKDNTLFILRQLAKIDNRVKVIHKENGGVTSARLAGISAAKGEWIGFVDGDDYIEPNMYEILLNNARKYNADISHCGYKMIFPSRIDYYYNTGCLVQQDKINGLKDLLSGKIVEPGLWNKLFRSSLFDNLLNSNLMDMSVKINEDLLMNFYLFREAKWSVFDDRCYYHYNVHKDSTVTSGINEHKLCDPLHVLKIIKRETKNELEIQNIVNARIAYQLIKLSTMPVGKNPILIKLYRKRARKELRVVLPDIMREPCSKKIKLLSLWAAICPFSYYFVHKVYSAFRGTERKYEVR